MDNKRLARELVRLAKDISAIDRVSPLSGEDMRKSYYKLADGFYELFDTEDAKKDMKLKKILSEIKRDTDKLYRHLNDTYTWD